MASEKPVGRWLTRNVLAIGMLSLFSDMGHELGTSLLPIFLATLGGGAAALGLIEGVSDMSSSVFKLWMSFHSDRIGRRKPILLIGYAATTMMGALGFAVSWWQVLIVRVFAWMGRGARGPVRDALLSESVSPEAYGRAFGFEGAMDTIGAIVGPAIALLLVGTLPLHWIFLISFIPGTITVAIVLTLREVPKPEQPHLRLWKSLRDLPAHFWKYTGAVGIFGLGNFAHTLLVIYVVKDLTRVEGTVHARQAGIALYILHNVVYAATSYPAGALGDRINKGKLLAVGYGLFALMCLGFALCPRSLLIYAALFVLAGIYIGIVDAMERAIAADILPEKTRALGYGALATVNSVGDLVSSVVVGTLMAKVSSEWAFGYGAVLTCVGALGLLIWSRSKSQETSAQKERSRRLNEA